MASRPLCTYCAKPAIDHLGFNQYCSPRGETTFTTDRLIKRKTAVGVIAGMLAGIDIATGKKLHVDLNDSEYTTKAEEMLDLASM